MFLVPEGGGKLVYVYVIICEESCIGVCKYKFWKLPFLSMAVQGLPVGTLREECLDIGLSGKRWKSLWIIEWAF